jgi:hypothetical protein
MPIVIQPYRPEHESAVAEFNQRLRAGGEDENMVFYKSSQPRWLPRSGDARIYNEFFVAVDASSDKREVHGGYALKTQEFLFPNRQVRSIAYYHHPLSEGLVNKTHAMVGTLLLRDAMQRTPLLYCLGMGGYDRPLPQMLIRLGWTHFPVPFLFKVVNASRFLRNMETLRSSPTRRLAMDLAAFSGVGWAGMKALEGYSRLRGPSTSETECASVTAFDGDAQELWDRAKETCSFTAVRDYGALRMLYPETETNLTRIMVKREGTIIGWAVVGERRKDAKYGEMRVGSVVDCFALSQEFGPVVRCATDALIAQGFDLILTNQSHQEWGEAFRKAGYLTGPSNFIFAASKKLAELLVPFEKVRPRMHFTRADGDGLPRNY